MCLIRFLHWLTMHYYYEKDVRESDGGWWWNMLNVRWIQLNKLDVTWGVVNGGDLLEGVLGIEEVRWDVVDLKSTCWIEIGIIWLKSVQGSLKDLLDQQFNILRTLNFYAQEFMITWPRWSKVERPRQD